MRGRREDRSGRPPRLRWLFGVAGLAVAGAIMVSLSPAQAASTVNAQLTLTGIASASSPTGGSIVGVHPGDTVNLTAGALPTAGLSNVPGLGSLLQSVVGGLNGQYQVVASFGGAFPGGGRTVTIGGPQTGSCAGQHSVSFTFPNRGTYNFTWKVQYVLPGLLGCTKSGLSSTDLNALAKAGVALNANNGWVGQIVVADNPPKGGISLQLPGVSVAPSILGHQLPTLGIPGVVLPTIPIGGLPNLNSNPAGNPAANTSGPAVNDTAVIPVPAEVVPGGPNLGSVGGGGFNVPAMPALTALPAGNNSGLLPVSGPTGAAGAAVGNVADGGKVTAPPRGGAAVQPRSFDLASSDRSSASQLSVVLAILAIVALTLVAATYARLYLLRR